MRVPLAAVALAALLFAAACGGDSDPKPTPTAAAPGPDLSDEEYLKVLCQGITDFQDALLSAPTSEKIAEAIDGYVTNMDGVNPPGDLRQWHADYLQYLRNARDGDPTSLVTADPPQPDQDVSDRLALKWQQVDECKYPTFLRSSEATPTPEG